MTQNPWGPAGGESSTPPRRSPEDPPRRAPENEADEGIRFVDNRKVDPQTFQPRPPDRPAQAGSEEVPAGGAEPQQEAVASAGAERVAELTADLQRLSAEYANYRKRVDRDRELNRDRAVANVVADLMPILDDIDRARSHGELDGGFKAVADAVEAMAAKYGLSRYGEAGEPFDPHVHEAMTSEEGADVAEPTVSSVYQVGYRMKDQVLRPARVAVANP